jgi:hypothetical protein
MKLPITIIYVGENSLSMGGNRGVFYTPEEDGFNFWLDKYEKASTGTLVSSTKNYEEYWINEELNIIIVAYRQPKKK